MMKEIPGEQFTHVQSDDPRLPVVVRRLGAQAVVVERNHVRIEFGGGFYHQGFDAYPVGAVPPDYGPDRQGVTHREVIPGLWYYEEE
jgi:hypothetical protein